ncbi:MAG: 50S ribosomal protein L25 [Ktedonobacteraceae bacterium]
MAEQTELKVTPRTVVGKANNRLRREGMVPANIYGHQQPAMPIQLDAVEFERVRRVHGIKNIFALRMPNASVETALIRKMQHNPKTGKIIHVDFARVSLRERVEVSLPLNYIGEAPGVKIEGGVFLHMVDALTVECTASDIIESLDVDISSLTDIDATLHASDIKLPANFVLITNPEEPIAKIAAPRVEEAAPVAEAEAAPTAPADTKSAGDSEA